MIAPRDRSATALAVLSAGMGFTSPVFATDSIALARCYTGASSQAAIFDKHHGKDVERRHVELNIRSDFWNALQKSIGRASSIE
jgi:hypothetical protein